MNSVKLYSDKDFKYVGNYYCLTHKECKLFITEGFEHSFMDMGEYSRFFRNSYD